MRYLGIKNINIMNEAALKLLYVNCEKLYTIKSYFWKIYPTDLG